MKILKRESLLSKLRSHYDTDLIKILVGMRRCGKTTLMLQIMDELKEKGVSNNNIIHINFEIRKCINQKNMRRRINAPKVPLER